MYRNRTSFDDLGPRLPRRRGPRGGRRGAPSCRVGNRAVGRTGDRQESEGRRGVHRDRHRDPGAPVDGSRRRSPVSRPHLQSEAPAPREHRRDHGQRDGARAGAQRSRSPPVDEDQGYRHGRESPREPDEFGVSRLEFAGLHRRGARKPERDEASHVPEARQHEGHGPWCRKAEAGRTPPQPRVPVPGRHAGLRRRHSPTFSTCRA